MFNFFWDTCLQIAQSILARPHLVYFLHSARPYPPFSQFAVSLRQDLSLMVCDLFLAQVDDALMRVGVAVLKVAQPELLSLESEEDLLMNYKQVRYN